MPHFIRRDTRRRPRPVRGESRLAPPTCSRPYTTLPMDQVAAAVGAYVKVGQSPFALARGHRFERLLFERRRRAAARALSSARARAAPSAAAAFLDLRPFKRNGGSLPHLEASRARFRRGAASRCAPLPRAMLVARCRRSWLRRPSSSRGRRSSRTAPSPSTSSRWRRRPLRLPSCCTSARSRSIPTAAASPIRSKLATTRAQAGLYLHALQARAARLRGRLRAASRLRPTASSCSPRTGSNHPSVRAGEDLRVPERAGRSCLRPAAPGRGARGARRCARREAGSARPPRGHSARAQGVQRGVHLVLRARRPLPPARPSR